MLYSKELMDQMELKYYYHIEASEPKSVNYQYIQYGVNSLRLGDLHINSTEKEYCSFCHEIRINRNSIFKKLQQTVSFPDSTSLCCTVM